LQILWLFVTVVFAVKADLSYSNLFGPVALEVVLGFLSSAAMAPLPKGYEKEKKRIK